MNQCFRNEATVVNEDRISKLPESLILHILSFLRTQEVVATSALSKQWKSLWKIVPKLDFDSRHNKSEHETFSEIVCRVLLSNKAPVLESLDLTVQVGNSDASVIGIWIGIAYARHIRELKLNVDSVRKSFKFPRCLYNHETLEKLILWNCVLIDAPSRVCLKSLRTLHLHHMEYEDSASIVNLLSGCSNLKNLVVSRNLPDSKIFTIAVPSLQTLTIFNGCNWRGDGYLVNAPCLKYLKIQGFNRIPFRLIEIALELVEATIMHSSITIDGKLLGSLTSVKSLSLISSPLKITLSTGCVFYRLVYLELSTHIADWWNLLFLMLDSSPKLQVLKLISRGFVEKNMWLLTNGMFLNVCYFTSRHFCGVASKSSTKRRNNPKKRKSFEESDHLCKRP